MVYKWPDRRINKLMNKYIMNPIVISFPCFCIKDVDLTIHCFIINFYEATQFMCLANSLIKKDIYIECTDILL